jgi:glycosyltransferase involved in cell wall biosynthesis
MHVLILPSWYPRFDGDAEGSFFRDQAQALASRGLRVGVVFADLRGPGRYFRLGWQSGLTVRADGMLNEVRSHGFNWFSRNATGYRKLWCWHARRAFDVYCERFGKPDIIHVHSMEPAAHFAAQVKARYGIPFVTTEHSTYHLAPSVVSASQLMYSQLARASDANLAVSEVFAEKLNIIYGGDWSYLPNIVSDRFLSHRLIKERGEEINLVSVAFLSRRKRMDLAIAAVSLLKNRGIEAALSIIGDGSERSRLENMVDDLKLRAQVKFVGQVASTEMPVEMAKGNILVSASERETFGVTLVEAMALGMPVVATRSGGPESIVTSDVGRLADDWSAEAIADSIEQIVTSGDGFRPAAIRANCASRFSAAVISEALDALYSRVVSHAAR